MREFLKFKTYPIAFLICFSMFLWSFSTHGIDDEKKKSALSRKERAKLKKEVENASFGEVFRNEFELLPCLFDAYDLEDDALVLICEVSLQTMKLFHVDTYVDCFSISTSSKGIGNMDGSYQTPLGMHRLDKVYCEDCPPGTIVRGLYNTKKMIDIYTDTTEVNGDYLTTRVITLVGMDYGINKGGNNDSRKRGVMIHGTPEEGFIGSPKSKGCVRMYNDEVTRLSELIESNKDVYLYIME